MTAETPAQTSALARAARGYRPVIALVALFSIAINGLMFVGPIYMLQVYDRVLASRSEETLVAISGLAAATLALIGVVEVIRSRILVRAGALFDAALGTAVFEAVLARPERGTGTQPLRDLDTLRDFLMGTAPILFCDVPWAPLYLALAFLLHPMIGVAATIAVVAVLGLGLANEWATRRTLGAAALAGQDAAAVASAALRNAEAVRAMGMGRAFARRWSVHHDAALRLQGRASDRAGLVVSAAKVARLAASSGILGVGAWLVIENQITAGAMFAASLLMGRALAPADGAIQHWKSFIAARDAKARLAALLDAVPAAADPMPLPTPTGALAVENLSVVPPGAARPTLAGVSFALRAGSVMGLVGPSGSGKSTLLRALVGVWSPAAGSVRLDGARLDQYGADRLGDAVGYLPQDVELFAGTVAENIARFGEVDAAAVAAAATMAGVHELILRLPAGYDTPVGPGGAALSGGQRQRIALARALYRFPKLIVLDEPNASLDADGEDALARAISAAAKTGSTVVVSTHKPSLLAAADTMLVLADGAPRLFGPRQQVMARLAAPVREAA